MSEDDWSIEDWKHDQQEQREIEKIHKPPRKIIDKKQSVDQVEIESENKPVPSSLNDKILRGIDNGLDAFGKNVKEIFYSEMETTKQLKRDEIPENMEQFQTMIEQFFKAGSPLVERSIGKGILLEFKLSPPSGVNFKTAIEIVKLHPDIQPPQQK